MSTIVRRRALDELPEPVCPAALPVAGVTPERAGFVCRVIEQDRGREAGLNMNPAQLAIARRGGDGDTFLTIKTDPSSVLNLCSGCAVPVLDERDVPGHRASYTYCPVWQAEKDRIHEGREMLSEPVEEEPVSYGVNSSESEDPWAAARRDLDVLAPE